MGYMKEKVSYLRGLSDGLQVQDETQKKLFDAIIEVLDSMADTVDENEAGIAELDECVDDLYDCVDELEEFCDECCADCDCCDCELDEDDDMDMDDFVEVDCPHCNETIFYDAEMLQSRDPLICPNCNEEVVPALEDEEEPEE